MKDIHEHNTSQMLERMDALALSEKNPEDGIKACFEALIAALEAERGFVLLFNTEKTELYAYLGHGVNPENLFVSEDISQTIIFAVVEDDKPLLTNNAMGDPRFATKISVQVSGIRSVLCVPLRSHGGLLGLMYMDNRFSAGHFKENDKVFLIECGKKFSGLLIKNKLHLR